MFYSLTGKLIVKDPAFAVIECGGVGFQCFTTMYTQRNLPSVGETVTLFTHLNVKEDALTLFGFSSRAELNCFVMLTGVSGVGPKVGLSILSELTGEQVAISVAAGDYKAFTRASGVGPKLAQRIVLELRDKVKAMSGGGPAGSGIPAGVISAAGNVSEAINALSVLGYTPSDVSGILARLDSNLPVEELIRQALRAMGSKK